MNKYFWPLASVIFCVKSPSCPQTSKESSPAAEFLGENALIISPTNKRAALSALVCELPQESGEHTLACQEAEQSQEAEQTEQE